MRCYCTVVSQRLLMCYDRHCVIYGAVVGTSILLFIYFVHCDDY